MFPWQSGSSGEEETQIIHLNPMSGKWGPDYSHNQRHVSFAIAYNLWNHWKLTEDMNFLKRFGAETLLSIAHFGGSMAKYDSKDGRFHIEGVMGPDEFHERLPNSSKAGFKDNAYTNFMVVWTLIKAKEALSLLPEGHRIRILQKLKLSEAELSKWDEIIHKMNIIISKDEIISQFDGYFKLKELDWTGYKQEYGNIKRMDRILKAEGKSADEYKVSKQADVLMIFYLFPFFEIQEIFKGMGYHIDKHIARKNYDYYIKRTSHGSTLSKVVHCLIAQKFGKLKDTWNLFSDVLESDIYDTQGGTTPEGIHCGVMGGSIDIVLRGFVGLRLVEKDVNIDPNLPKHWRKIELKFLYRDQWFNLSVTHSQIAILVSGSKTKHDHVSIRIQGKPHRLTSGKTFTCHLS